MTDKEKAGRRFFRLFPDVIHFSGSSAKGTLCLLAEKRLVILGKLSNEIVGRTEENLSVSQVAEQMGVPEFSVAKALERLEGMGAGFFPDSPCFVEKVRQPDLTAGFMLYATPPVVNSLKIALAGECSQNCAFCEPAGLGDRLKPCIGCGRGPGNGGRALSGERIKKALREAALLDCKHLILAAGDPAPVADLALETIAAAQESGFTAVEYFSGSPLPDALLKGFAAGAVIPTLQIFSHREEAHDRVFGEKGGFGRLVENMEFLRKSNRPFNLYFLHTGVEEDPLAAVQGLKEFGPAMIACDRLLTGTSPAGDFLSGPGNLATPDIDSYVKWLEKERCLDSILTLNHDGAYHFCPALFDKAAGDVDGTTIQGIFADLDAGRIEAAAVAEAARCQGCEFTLACRVCKAAAPHPETRTAPCGYEPGAGEWLSTGPDQDGEAGSAS